MSTRLTGQALLTKIKEMDGATKSELARACGYSRLTKKGETRLDVPAMLEAICIANGYNLVAGTRTIGRGLSWQVTVHLNGNVLIGKGYTEELGMNPGTEFQIRGRAGGGLELVPITADLSPAASANGNGAQVTSAPVSGDPSRQQLAAY